MIIVWGSGEEVLLLNQLYIAFALLSLQIRNLRAWDFCQEHCPSSIKHNNIQSPYSGLSGGKEHHFWLVSWWGHPLGRVEGHVLSWLWVIHRLSGMWGCLADAVISANLWHEGRRFSARGRSFRSSPGHIMRKMHLCSIHYKDLYRFKTTGFQDLLMSKWWHVQYLHLTWWIVL